MQYRTLIFVLLAITATGADFHLRLEDNSVEFRTKDGDKVKLCSSKLFYEEKDDGFVPATERYVVEFVNDRPRIIDGFDCHTVSFQLADVDDNPGDELLMFYFSGGNQFGVKLYEVRGIDVTPLKTQPHSSNMRSVKVKGKNIIVETEEHNLDGGRFISTEIYSVMGGECKLVKEQNGPLFAPPTEGNPRRPAQN